MKRTAYGRYVDSEGVVHAAGSHVAVNAGLCGNDDNRAETDAPVDCRACISVDQHVRKHAALSHGEGRK